jgi:hypothetical protein
MVLVSREWGLLPCIENGGYDHLTTVLAYSRGTLLSDDPFLGDISSHASTHPTTTI